MMNICKIGTFKSQRSWPSKVDCF